MKSHANEIKSFLIDAVCYQNSHKIEFDVLDNSVMVSYNDYHNPDHRYLDFFLFYEKNIHRFLYDFSITSLRDLDKVTIDWLWQLFWQGKGMIYCGLDFSMLYYPLYFNCVGTKLYTIGDNDKSQEVMVPLTTIGDFTSYTYQQFKNSSCSPQNSSCTPQSVM